MERSSTSEKKIENGYLVVFYYKKRTQTTLQMASIDITESFNKHIIENTEYVSHAILIDIMKKIGQMKFPKQLVELVKGLHVITLDDGRKVFLKDDVNTVISNIVISEMDVVVQNVAIDQSNIVKPAAQQKNEITVDEKIAVAVDQTVVVTPEPDESDDDSSDDESETSTSKATNEPLPHIVSMRVEIVPHTGLKTTTGAEFKPGMNVDERSAKVDSMIAQLFVGGINTGRFTITWSSGNKIVQDIDPENVHASVAFVLNMQEVEARNDEANYSA